MFEKLSRHAELVTRMADKLGRDPVEDMKVDPSKAYAWRSAVIKCTACPNPEACSRILAENDNLDAAPVFCRNQAYLDTLPEKSA